MRKYRLDRQLESKDTWKLENVHILVRISNAFANPRCDLFVDPWRLFTSDMLVFQNDWTLTASIVNEGRMSDSSYQSTSQSSSINPGGQLHRLQTPNTYSYGSEYYGSQSTTDQYHQFRGWQNNRARTEAEHRGVGADVSFEFQRSSPPQQPHDLPPEQSSLFAPNQAKEQLQATAMHTMQQNAYQPQGAANQSDYRVPNTRACIAIGTNLASRNQNQQKTETETESRTMSLNVTISSKSLGDASDYRYLPLNRDEVRLLMLSPGTRDSQLRAVVFKSPLARVGNFQAISYTWGSTELPHSLWTPEGTIKVTSSLYSVLRCLRHEEQATILWADGICINQSDTKEKVDQIRLLPRVFQRATCVLACLGDDADGESAMEILMQIRVDEALSILGDEWPKDLPKIPLHWAGKRIPPATDAAWAKIGSLFGKPWFQRAWIIQEVAVATSVRVICGRWMVDWNDLYTAVEVIERESRAPPTDPFALAQPKWGPFLTLARLREREARHDRIPLLNLLENFRYTKSTIDHDRIFCLLGLAKDGNNKDFVVEYEASFSTVAQRYAWAFIRQGRVMELLHRAGVGSRQRSWASSWIPDWASPKQDGLRSLAKKGVQYAASKHDEPCIEFRPMSNEFELRVRGLKADVVQAISVTSNVPQELGLYLAEVERMTHSICSAREGDLIWRVPIARTAHSVGDGSDLRKSYTVLREYLAEQGKQHTSEHTGDEEVEKGAVYRTDRTDSSWTQSQNYILALQEAVLGWRFIITERRFVGIAPPSVRVGDVISILDGGVVPFLLRESQSRRGSFQLVGECFVDSLMSGEGHKLGVSEEMLSLY